MHDMRVWKPLHYTHINTVKSHIIWATLVARANTV